MCHCHHERVLREPVGKSNINSIKLCNYFWIRGRSEEKRRKKDEKDVK